MKKVFFGVAVVAIALSASAFTSATVAAGDAYANTSSGSNPTYQKLTSPYSSTNCQQVESNACAYIVTTEGASIVTASSYTQSQLEDFENDGYVTETSERGLYLIP